MYKVNINNFSSDEYTKKKLEDIRVSHIVYDIIDEKVHK
jgi:hypothetical protein